MRPVVVTYGYLSGDKSREKERGLAKKDNAGKNNHGDGRSRDSCSLSPLCSRRLSSPRRRRLLVTLQSSMFLPLARRSPYLRCSCFVPQRHGSRVPRVGSGDLSPALVRPPRTHGHSTVHTLCTIQHRHQQQQLRQASTQPQRQRQHSSGTPGQNSKTAKHINSSQQPPVGILLTNQSR